MPEAERARSEVPSSVSPLATLLAADVLAVDLAAPVGEKPVVSLELDGEAVALDFLHCNHGASQGEGHLLVAVIGAPGLTGDAVLRVKVGDEEHVFGPAPLRSFCVDLRTVLRERLAPLPPSDRAAVLDLLDEAAATDPPPDDRVGLSTSRALARGGLREPLPPSAVERDEPQGLQFDSVLALSDTAFYLRGWARDGQAPLVRLTAVSPEGSRIELLPGICRDPRPDVDAFYGEPTGTGADGTGFLCYCETRSPSLLSTGWVLEMENALGVGREVGGPQVSRDLLAARAAILSDLHKERSWDTALTDHVVTAVSRIQERLEKRVEIEEVLTYGEAPEAPTASIVVPLYGRIDFLEHQLAQFVHDPELRESDLIYVLDSPDLASALETTAGQLFELYGVPFRVAVLSQNGGYSLANNRGATLARGRMLLLLNSDVLPAGPGWLGRMIDFYDQQDSIGALGPKLLFEDDTLQHAGIRFQRPPGGGAWENEHYFKGLHRDLPAANVTRRVPAVSGACLLTDRELFEEMSGLRGMYVQGDYEDTDLCLRLRQAGRDTWYLPEVELYHLEGQSYALETRHAMSRYNVLLHTRLWDEEIEAAMS
jgi:GT2 family glycosyltransferase